MNKKSWMIGCLLISLILTFMASCVQKKSYEERVQEELAKEIRYDSIIYEVKLGMTYDDFYFYCFKRNLEGIFKPNPTGTMASLKIEEGFSAPVLFEFFPDTSPDNDPIYKFKANLRYVDFSYYNRKYAIENLVKEALDYFEGGYGGHEFFTVPHENKLLKYKYIKIDGNRKILIKPTFTGEVLEMEFEDLSRKRNNINEKEL